MSDLPEQRVEDPNAENGEKDDATRTAETLLHGKVQEQEETGGDDNFRFYQQAESQDGGSDNFQYYQQEGQGPSALQRDAYDPDLDAKDHGHDRPQERVQQGDVVIENNITVITEGPLAGCMAIVRPDGRVEYYRGEQLRFDRHAQSCNPQPRYQQGEYHDPRYQQEVPYHRQGRQLQGRPYYVPSNRMPSRGGGGYDYYPVQQSGGRVYQEDRGSSREGGIRTPNYDSTRRSDDYGHVYESEGYGQPGYGRQSGRGYPGGTPPIIDDRGSPERRDVPNREYNLEILDRVLGGVDILGQHGVFGRNRGGRDSGRGYDPRDSRRGSYDTSSGGRQRQGRIDYKHQTRR